MESDRPTTQQTGSGPQAAVVQIDRSSLHDVPVLLGLAAQYWAFEGLAGFDPSRLRAPLQRLLSSPHLGTVWLARRGQEAIGYAILVYVFSLEHAGITAEIDELFVVPAQRGTGVGARLLAEAESEASRRGCTNISLQIARSNARAETFYRRHGYAARPAFGLLEKDLDAVEP